MRMRSRYPLTFILFLALALASGLRAADPLGALLPEGLGKPGLEIGLIERAAERALWFGEQGAKPFQPLEPSGQYYVSQKQVELTLQTRWQASPRWLVELLVPYSFMEYSPYTGNSFLPFSVNDPHSYFGDAWGDLKLRARYFSPQAMGPAALRIGFYVAASAPTGRGPFSASHITVATGSGTWLFEGGLMASQRAGSFKFFQQLSGTMPLGYGGDIPPGTVLAPDPEGLANVTYPSGPAWIQPGEIYQAALGFSYDFYRGPGSVLSIGTEVTGSQSTPLALGGTAIPGTDQKSLGLLPEFNIEFATHFNLQGGLVIPLLLVHQIGPEYFEPVLRAGYVF